jgi:hypothetical protein
MKLENQVCSLELSKKLNELRVKQDSLFYYHSDSHKIWTNKHPEGYSYSAFTVAELGELLGYWISTRKLLDNYWRCICHVIDYEHEIIDLNEANARAKMLIHLIEKGLLSAATLTN